MSQQLPIQPNLSLISLPTMHCSRRNRILAAGGTCRCVRFFTHSLIPIKRTLYRTLFGNKYKGILDPNYATNICCVTCIGCLKKPKHVICHPVTAHWHEGPVCVDLFDESDDNETCCASWDTMQKKVCMRMAIK